MVNLLPGEWPKKHNAGRKQSVLASWAAKKRGLAVSICCECKQPLVRRPEERMSVFRRRNTCGLDSDCRESYRRRERLKVKKYAKRTN